MCCSDGRDITTWGPWPGIYRYKAPTIHLGRRLYLGVYRPTAVDTLKVKGVQAQ